MNRHTMGQDSAGRMSYNPPGCPLVTRKDVERFAHENGFGVWRDGPTGMWWATFRGIKLTAGMTNFLAKRSMQRRLVDEG